MTFIALIAVGLIAYAALQVARVVSAPRMRAAARLAQIDAYGFETPTVAIDEEERRGLIATLGGLLQRQLNPAAVAVTRARLLGAGMYGTSVETFLGYRVLSMIITPLFMFYITTADKFSPVVVAGAVGLGALTGWSLPQAYISRRARLRLDRIDHGMPELVDLLVVGVESGMGFAGAMRAASQRIDGPLGEELQLVLREQTLGATLSDGLRHLLERCDTPATRSFVRTLVQGERLGVSIGQMMRSLADEMRKRRKARAEELAHKAPVKIMFPLVFLLFPAIFIVLLAPAVINITKQFGGS